MTYYHELYVYDWYKGQKKSIFARMSQIQFQESGKKIIEYWLVPQLKYKYIKQITEIDTPLDPDFEYRSVEFD